MIWPFAKPLPPLDAASSARRNALAQQKIDLKQPLADMRWCVVDTETGGLDAQRDPLLAIGAVASEQRGARFRRRGQCCVEDGLDVRPVCGVHQSGA